MYIYSFKCVDKNNSPYKRGFAPLMPLIGNVNILNMPESGGPK